MVLGFKEVVGERSRPVCCLLLEVGLRGIGGDVRWRSCVVVAVRGGVSENWGSRDRGGLSLEGSGGDSDASCRRDGAADMTMRQEEASV